LYIIKQNNVWVQICPNGHLPIMTICLLQPVCLLTLSLLSWPHYYFPFLLTIQTVSVPFILSLQRKGARNAHAFMSKLCM
jgi:hypothetical protein